MFLGSAIYTRETYRQTNWLTSGFVYRMFVQSKHLNAILIITSIMCFCILLLSSLFLFRSIASIIIVTITLFCLTITRGLQVITSSFVKYLQL